ncbi:hypothetical protein ACLOJK_005283 [Asimina triloba]
MEKSCRRIVITPAHRSAGKDIEYSWYRSPTKFRTAAYPFVLYKKRKQHSLFKNEEESHTINMECFSFLIVIFPAITLLFFSLLLCRFYVGKSFKSTHFPPVMGTIYHQLFYFHDLYDKQTEILRRNPTYRLLNVANSEVYTADPRNAEHFLKTAFDSYSKGEYNSRPLRDLFGYGIFAVDGEKWRQQRKIANSSFSGKIMKLFSCCVFQRSAARMVHIISDFVVTKQAFDIQDLFSKCTLDSIFRIGVGIDYNFLKGANKEANEFISAFDEACELVIWREVDFFWRIKRFLNVGSEAVLRRSIQTIDKFVYGVIQKKRGQIAADQGSYRKKEDVLSSCLEESDVTDRYLRDILLSLVIAGRDTTANTLSWFIYMMCKNPSIQEKIAQQVRETVDGGDDGNAEDFVRRITDSTLEKMHYLHAALTETLRLYPSVPVTGKCADKDDVLPDGYVVKKGDGIYYVAYAMGRMPYIWGDDAEEFRPERWQQNGVFQPKSQFKFIAFHAGPRICLGKDLAYRQMKMVAMVLLRFFVFRLEDEKKPVKYRTTFTLHIDGGLNVHAISRMGPSLLR